MLLISHSSPYSTSDRRYILLKLLETFVGCNNYNNLPKNTSGEGPQIPSLLRLPTRRPRPSAPPGALAVMPRPALAVRLEGEMRPFLWTRFWTTLALYMAPSTF